VVVVILLSIVVVGVSLVIVLSEDPEEKEIEEFTIEGNNALVTQSAVDDGDFHFYSHETNDGTEIKIFVVRGSDGKFHNNGGGQPCRWYDHL